MPILVTNPKDHSVQLRSFDGESVTVGPKATRVSVANKFAWHVPPGVRVEENGHDGSTPEGAAMGHVDPTKVFKVDTHLFMSRRPPKGHNPRALERHHTAQYFRDLADRKKAARLAAKQRADLEAAAKKG